MDVLAAEHGRDRGAFLHLPDNPQAGEAVQLFGEVRQ